MRRKQGTWMSKWDDRLLEYIEENGSGAPTEISSADFMPISKQYASKRLKELSERNLLEPLGNGVYQITKEGLMYLYGDYDAEAGEILVDIDKEIEEYGDKFLDSKDSKNNNLRRIYRTKLRREESDKKIRKYVDRIIHD